MKIKIAWGIVLALLITALPHGLLLLLIQFKIELGKHVLSAMLVFAAAALEFPALVVGRLLKLPLENSPTGFILPDFNLGGYVAMFLFWAGVGGCVGWILDRRQVPAKKIYSGLLWTALIAVILLLWAVRVFVFDF